MKPLKEKKCKIGGELFVPVRPFQPTCFKHAPEWLRKQQAKKWRKEGKVMKEKLKTHNDYVKELQVIFNIFIRERDKDKPCVSCGTPMTTRKGDASHYWSVGGNPGVRFDETNCHLACVPCNQHKHGNLLEYSIRLPERIGTVLFNALNARRTRTNPLTIPEIKDLKTHYRKLIKSLT